MCSLQSSQPINQWLAHTIDIWPTLIKTMSQTFKKVVAFNDFCSIICLGSSDLHCITLPLGQVMMSSNHYSQSPIIWEWCLNQLNLHTWLNNVKLVQMNIWQIKKILSNILHMLRIKVPCIVYLHTCRQEGPTCSIHNYGAT